MLLGCPTPWLLAFLGRFFKATRTLSGGGVSKRLLTKNAVGFLRLLEPFQQTLSVEFIVAIPAFFVGDRATRTSPGSCAFCAVMICHRVTDITLFDVGEESLDVLDPYLNGMLYTI